MNEIKLPVRAVQEAARIAPQVWFVIDAEGNKLALSNKESVDAIVEAMNTNRVALLQERIVILEAYIQSAKDWFDRFGEHAPIYFGGEDEMSNIAAHLLAEQVQP